MPAGGTPGGASAPTASATLRTVAAPSRPAVALCGDRGGATACGAGGGGDDATGAATGDMLRGTRRVSYRSSRAGGGGGGLVRVSKPIADPALVSSAARACTGRSGYSSVEAAAPLSSHDFAGDGDRGGAMSLNAAASASRSSYVAATPPSPPPSPPSSPSPRRQRGTSGMYTATSGDAAVRPRVCMPRKKSRNPALAAAASPPVALLPNLSSLPPPPPRDTVRAGGGTLLLEALGARCRLLLRDRAVAVLPDSAVRAAAGGGIGGAAACVVREVTTAVAGGRRGSNDVVECTRRAVVVAAGA